MDKEQEKWAIFWCDLLSPVIYGEIEAELTNRFLKQVARKKIAAGVPGDKFFRHRRRRFAIRGVLWFSCF